jgi:Disulphide bond corrector protein DsbC
MRPATWLIAAKITATIVSESPGSSIGYEEVIAMTPNRRRTSIRLLAATFDFVVLFSTVSTQGQNFQFDASISPQVLDNYLNRSISFAELLHDDLEKPRNRRGVDPRDHIRLILSSKAKFLGRAILVWGQEGSLPAFLRTAKRYAEALHKADPEIILQGTAFEIVSSDVQSLPVPEKVFAEFGLPNQQRNFHYRDMLYANGRFANHWGGSGSVPDMSRLETRMWFYFLAQSYIDAGIEAIHFGQVALMDDEDPVHVHWIDILDRVRAYARKHARRHYVLCDAPCPTGAYVERGKLLFDFHSAALGIAEVADRPYQGVLIASDSNAGFFRRPGGITPSGWSCTHAPYLFELDNFGVSNPGKPSKPPFVWGWDQITWFALLPDAERNQWLRYAWKWVKERDPDCHLQMPGSRILTPGKPNAPRWYWANTRSDGCPARFNTESTIKELWGTKAPDPAAPAATRIKEISVPDPTPGEPVTAVMTIQPNRAAAGETVEVKVRVRIASAHFIHAPGEAGAPFIPIAVNAQLPAGVEPVGDWQLPPPEKGNGTALVYRDSVVLRRSFKVVSMSTSESLLVTGELRYQVCTDELCWPRGKLQLSAPLTIHSPRR